MDDSLLHCLEDGFNDIQKLSARRQRHELNNWTANVCLIPAIEVINPLHQLIRSMPGSCIPGDVDSRLTVVLVKKYFCQVDHARRVFCISVEPSHLVSLST